MRQNNIHGAEAGKAFSDMLAQNTVLKELDLSSQQVGGYGHALDAAFAKEFAVGISDNGALTSLHVGRNNIPEKEMREIMVITMRMDSIKILCEIPFKDKTLTELDVSGKNLGTEGALVVAGYLDGNRALTSIDISNNDIGQTVCPEGWAHVNMMNGSGDYHFKHSADGKTQIQAPEGVTYPGVVALANGIKNNGAISQFTFSGDTLYNSKPVTMETSMVEADFSGKVLGVSGAIMVGAFLPKCT
jgi:hypothetical protein